MRRTPAADILDYIIPLLYLPVFTIWVLVTKQASHTHKLFIVWVSATKQASHTLKLSTAWVSATKQASHTLKLSAAWVSAARQASHTLELFIAWVSATKQASHTLKLSIAWVSATKQASHTLKLSAAWVSAMKQASHTHKLFTLRRKKGTEELAPIICAHVEAEEGHREACPYHLCPRLGRRRVQKSLFLSPVPTLRRKKGTEELVPISCAHTEAKEWAQAELVRSTATLRYAPCIQFINVSQKALHIYWQPTAMSHAIHKIVSQKRCQSYFISRRSPHHGISKDSDLCASAHRCPHYAYTRLIAQRKLYIPPQRSRASAAGYTGRYSGSWLPRGYGTGTLRVRR